MIDPTEHEVAAMEESSRASGQYIESWIGKTDMAVWEYNEWMGFLECVNTAYTDKLRDLCNEHIINPLSNKNLTEDDIPY